MARSKATSVADYLAELPPERAAVVGQVIAIHEAARKLGGC